MNTSPFSVSTVVSPPSEPSELPAWRAFLEQWRSSELDRLHYDGSLYDQLEFGWTQSCYTCAIVMLWDEEFYDRATGHYTVENYLRRGATEFGGYDAVLLWQAYPRIGFDERNQFDFFREAPGGLAGLRAVVDELHAAGVRALVAYKPWDVGTRGEPTSDATAMADIVAALDADGVLLDTMSHGADELHASIDAVKPGVAFQPEGFAPLTNIHNHHLSLAQGPVAPGAPGVLRNVWFERRHMQHVISRWDRDHSGELHLAWMNGVGVLVWENIFGTWNRWSDRDRALLRGIVPIQRQLAEVFRTGSWTPIVPTVPAGVYASRWDYDGLSLWTLANRSDQEIAGDLLVVDDRETARYAEVVGRTPLDPRRHDGTAVLTGRMQPWGMSAFVAADAERWRTDVKPLLDQPRMPVRLSSALAPERPNALRPVASAPADAVPTGMRRVEATERTLDFTYRVRESGMFGPAPMLGSDRIEGPGLQHDHVTEQRPVALATYAIDERPVTNCEFSRFIHEAGYTPAATTNFLRNWVDRRPTPGTEDEPVGYVDLDDARAYARWAGKRLPTDEEWQHALETTNAHYGTVRVWEWTEPEHSDEHTRFVLLKGGSDYQARGSDWYADGGPREPSFAAKLILHWPGLDRFATVGFRCAVDLAPGTGAVSG